MRSRIRAEFSEYPALAPRLVKHAERTLCILNRPEDFVKSRIENVEDEHKTGFTHEGLALAARLTAPPRRTSSAVRGSVGGDFGGLLRYYERAA